MPEKKLYDWLYSRTWSRQKCQYSREFSRPLGARCEPLFVQSGHWHGWASSRTGCRAACFLGLMRIESKNLDESIGMTDFDYAPRKASSLDITNTSGGAGRLTKNNLMRISGDYENPRCYHRKVARSFLAGKPRRPGRITPARRAYGAPAERRDPFPCVYCVAGLRRQ